MGGRDGGGDGRESNPASGAWGLGAGRCLARLGIDLRAGEGRSVALLFLTFFFILAFQYAAKSIRQATFVDSLGAVRLPAVYLAVALISYPVLSFHSLLVDRFSRRAILACSCGTVSASLVLFWWWFRAPGVWVAPAFYIWLSIVFALTVSQAWSLAGGVLDARQARRLFGIAGSGALLGAVLGGQVASWAGTWIGTRHALLVAGALLLPPIAIILKLEAAEPEGPAAAAADEAEGIADLRDGLSVVLRSRHLRLVAAVLALSVVIGQIVDLQFNWAVESTAQSLDQLTRSFGNLFSLIGLAAFVFQILVTTRIHQGLGVAAAARVTPIAMLLGSGLLLFASSSLPMFLVQATVALKMTETGLRYSLDQATRELLLMPVAARDRSKAKGFIDVLVQRGAKGIAALLLLPVAFGLMGPQYAVWLALLLSAVWLILTAPLAREYLRAFREGLLSRRVDPSVPLRLSDPATLEVLVYSLGSSDPGQVLNSVELLVQHGRGHLVLPLLLRHDDARVRRRTLEVLGEVGRADSTALVEQRLTDGDPEVRAAAIRVLAQLADSDVADLMVARLDERDARVRAAAVAALLGHRSEGIAERAEAVLDEMVADADPGVRAAAARALQEIREPLFQGRLVRLLYDLDAGVVRAAIRSVERRSHRGAFNPLYPPILVSLLRNRRLKHEARAALVSLGEPVIPTLDHFLRDSEESIWVRRALPKTLSGVGSPGAARALVDGLERAEDRFLRRKLVEALDDLPPEGLQTLRPRILAQCRVECRGHSEALCHLASLDLAGDLRLVGARVERRPGTPSPSLLELLLEERLLDHLEDAFELLAASHDRDAILGAWRGLRSPRRETRGHALEYLDNALDASVRDEVFAMIDDLPIERRLGHAADLFGLSACSTEESLGRLLDRPDTTGDASFLVMTAIERVVAEERGSLRGAVERLAGDATEPWVRETAAWAVRQWGRGPEEDGMSEMTAIEKVMFLRTVDLFRHCTGEQVLRLAAIARVRRLAQGQTVFRSGDPAMELYCVVGGEVALGEASGSRVVRPARTFGVVDILSGRLRSSDALARTEAVVLVMEAEDFFDLLANNIEIVKALFRLFLQAEAAQGDTEIPS